MSIQPRGVADTSLSGLRVARDLDNVRRRGWPVTVVSDNGTDLTSNAILPDGRQLIVHRAGQAPAERLIESFNGPLRDELPNETLFRSLPPKGHALGLARPHSRLGSTTRRPTPAPPRGDRPGRVRI
jgi:putative transposase